MSVYLLISNVFVQQSQVSTATQTLGKNKTAFRVQVSQPPLPALSGLRDLMGISSALPKLQFSPFAPPLCSEPNVLDESQGLLQEGNLSRYSGPLCVCVPSVRCICLPVGGALLQDGLPFLAVSPLITHPHHQIASARLAFSPPPPLT